MRRAYVGLDIGGSSAKIGVLDEKGTVVCRGKAGNATTGSARELVDGYCDAIDGLLAAAGVGASGSGSVLAGVGAGVPGYLDADGLPQYTNIDILNGYDLADHLSQRYRVPVRLDNDANMAALAEHSRGAGVGSQRLMLVTAGTGIGVAVIADGRLLCFTGHSTGNIGHLIVDPSSPEQCGWGCHGCLETVATAPAVRRRALAAAVEKPDGYLGARLAAVGAVDVPDVADGASSGDDQAVSIIRETGWWLGIGLASFCAVFNPDRVVVGGGLAELGPTYFAGIMDALLRVGFPAFVAGIPVLKAQLGNDAGFIGAALAAMEA